MAKSRSRMHGVAPREAGDRVAFVMAFFLGVFGGIALKVLGVHPLFTALYAAIILFGYAVATWANGRFHIDPESIGDNCYYLGFLFTLASLSFTLYQLASSESGGSPVAIPEVISGFGVALSSTIVGVFLRVLMLQMRPDFVAKDRAVRSDLNSALARFRKDMAGALSQLKSFSTESVQMAAERDERLRISTEKFVEDYHASLDEAANLLSKRVTNSFDRLDAGFEKMLKDIATKTEREFSTLAQNSISTVTEKIEKHAADVSETLESLVTDLANLRIRIEEQEADAFEVVQQKRSSVISAQDDLLASLEERQKELLASFKSFISDMDFLRSDQMGKANEVSEAASLYRTNLEELSKATRLTSGEINDKLLPSISKLEDGLTKASKESVVFRQTPLPENLSGTKSPAFDARIMPGQTAIPNKSK
ncbi:MAG: hypothetical protein JXR15_00825 [Shimia sp.]|uniref:hypothetical protein n=1 Tax=Shimia sp. TaxID=1954381 RepID=UPI003B8D7E5A